MTFTALPVLNHKLIGVELVGGTSGIEDILESVWTLISSTTYWDGSTRTPGSGSAWTGTREDGSGNLVSVRCTPPLSAVNEMRVVFGGETGAVTPVMATTQAYAASRFFMSTARGVTGGATFNGWASSPMYSTGDQTGFMGVFPSDTTTPKHVAILESQETLWVVVSQDAANWPCFVGCGGALVQPLGSTAESNGRVYINCASGYGGALSVPVTGNVGQRLFAHSSASTQSTGIILTPGSTAEVLGFAAESIMYAFNTPPITRYTDPTSEECVAMPYWVQHPNTYNTNVGAGIGWTREVGATVEMLCLNVFQDGAGNDTGYGVAPNMITTLNEGIVLLA